MIIQREIQNEIQDALNYYPVIVITGPRQTGKTTIARQ